VSDYRSINILPIFEKVLELVVKCQLEKFLEINDINRASIGFKNKLFMWNSNPNHCRWMEIDN